MSRPKGAPRGLYDGSVRSRCAPHLPSALRANRKNLYICDTCDGAVATEEVDEGVTPMFLACRVDGTENWDNPEKCKGQMQSQMYPPEPWPAMFTVTLVADVGVGGKVSTEYLTVAVPPVTFGGTARKAASCEALSGDARSR